MNMATSTIFEPIEIKSKKSVEKFAKMFLEHKSNDDEFKLPKNIRILTGKENIKKYFSKRKNK